MATENGMNGSEKQVAWANKIRDEKVSGIQGLIKKNPDISEQIERAVEYLGTKTNSKWWIDNQKNPPIAFLGYSNYKVRGEVSVDYFSTQGEKTGIPCSIGIIDLSKAKNPTKIINSIEIKTIYYSNGELSYQLSSKGFEEKEDEKSSIQPLKDFLPISISLNDTEIIAVKTFRSEDRLAGENITASLFTKDTQS
jgi:hypothetical protein